MNTAKKNDFGVSFRRLLTQPERIADEVGDLLNFPHLIIVREDDGVAFAFEFRDVRRQINAVINTRGYHRDNIGHIDAVSNGVNDIRDELEGGALRRRGENPGSQSSPLQILTPSSGLYAILVFVQDDKI